MAEDGPYQIMPYKEILSLKKEIEDLKKSPAGSDKLLDSMESLTKNMDNMLQLFKAAAEGMKQEEEQASSSKQLDPLLKKLDNIIEQNKTIAEGIVTLADMIQDKLEAPKRQPQKQQDEPTFPDFNQPRIAPRMGPPPMSFQTPGRIPPPDFPPLGQGNMPPPYFSSPGDIPQPDFPPPGGPKKKWLFGGK